MPDPVVVVGADGALVQANAALGRLVGTPPGKALAQPEALVAALAESGLLAASGRPMGSVRTPAATVTVAREDGGVVAVDATASPLPGGGAVCVLRRAGANPDALASPDAVTRHLADGVCVAASPSAVDLFGRPADRIVGRPFTDLVDPTDRPAVTARLAALEAGEVVEVSFRVPMPDGTSLWVDAIAGPTPGGFVCSSRDATMRIASEADAVCRAERADREAQEQAGLRRVAMEIAVASDADVALGMVAEEVSRLIGCDAGLVLKRVEDQAVVTAVGGASFATSGTVVPVPHGSLLHRLVTRNETVRGASDEVASLHDEEDAARVVAAPVRVGEELWGMLIAAGREGHDVPTGAEERLERFAELASVAVVAADTRARLSAQATTDPLTGLANHRTFHERLREEIARAQRYGRPLALALVDLDHFKRFNDTYGHQAGDHVLARVANLLRGTARRSELVARVGGEEFAWLLPETTAETAAQAVERARVMMASEALWGDERLTLSAGVCDLTQARDGDELYRHADAALYWSKAHGRNQQCIYSPEVVNAMSPEERTRRMERSRTLAALRSLARAVDAKDTSTSEHSVRVAGMARRLAVVLGWPRARAQHLRDAALLHDVGKLGVPDAILLKPGRLDPLEFEVVTRHAALGAEITSDVLDAEQCAWVRHHHERWDGRGYPAALEGTEIPEGARILAVADAWDVMTSVRPYGRVMEVDEAADELRACAGSQFWPSAVDALLRVVRGPAMMRPGA